MRIKLCGLFRDEDIAYANEARPDYIGFVFAPSRRRVSSAYAAQLRRRLSEGVIPVGVFVNAPVEDIAALYRDNVIDIAQLHGAEDVDYIAQLQKASALGKRKPIQVIKTVFSSSMSDKGFDISNADYYLIDSGAGGGKTFDWDTLKANSFNKAWFLAGGVSLDNIDKAMALDPFAIDISSGAETDGIKNREKMVQLVNIVRKNGGVLKSMIAL